MGTFILLIFFNWKAIDSAEFSNKERCEAAKAQVQATFETKGLFPGKQPEWLKVMCVQK